VKRPKKGGGRFVVTGGAGFIGSHTVELLVAAGASVLVVDDQSHACGEQPPAGVEVVTADCGSPEAASAIERFQPDAVLHLASKGGVQKAARDPGAHVKASLASTVGLFDAAVKAGARRVVTASSGGTIYGDAASLPARETSGPAPLSAYGAAKRAEEVYLATFGRRFGISTVAMRYGNVYGPRQDGTGEAGVVAITCNRLLNGDAPRVFGDGDQTRDFTYVGDVAAANVAALFGTRSGEVNIGTARETRINEIVERLVAESSLSPTTEYLPAREFEVRRVCLEVTRARSWFGWTPRVLVGEGLPLTWSWFSTRHRGSPND
jgi:UDP-glucose 4-epimerase